MTFDRPQFDKDRVTNATSLANDNELQALALEFIAKSYRHNHAYQWTWLDLPIIQATEDIIAAQELIWKVKPDVIIETGIAWGGSVVLSASILQLIGKGRVIAIDTVLPQKNIDAIMKYAFSSRISLIEGSSVDPAVLAKVKAHITPNDTVMVILDSNHTHEHVLSELNLYSPLVGKDSYLIVGDTIIEDIPTHADRSRPWGPGNNPKTAVDQFLGTTDRFEPDPYYNAKVLATFHRGGYLRCVK